MTATTKGTTYTAPVKYRDYEEENPLFRMFDVCRGGGGGDTLCLQQKGTKTFA